MLPFAFATASDIHGYDMVPGHEMGSEVVEGVGVAGQAVDHDDWRRPGVVVPPTLAMRSTALVVRCLLIDLPIPVMLVFNVAGWRPTSLSCPRCWATAVR